MASLPTFSITPAWLESVEGPNELVRLHVTFSGSDGALQKGRVLAWDGPGRGYSVRLLDCGEVVHGVMSESMSFLTDRGNKGAAVETSAGSLKGSRRSLTALGSADELRSCKWCGRSSARVKNTTEGPLCGVCQLRHVGGIGADGSGRAASGAVCAAGGGQEVNRKRPASDVDVVDRPPSMRERPVSIFIGVRPYWRGGR